MYRKTLQTHKTFNMRNYKKFYEKTINNFVPPKGFEKKVYTTLLENSEKSIPCKSFKKLLKALILVKGF